MLGVLNADTDPLLTEILTAHSLECLKSGVCRDGATGGLRLSSTSRNTWTSKVILTIYAMENVLDITLPEGMVQEVVNWGHVSAREATIADQIHCDVRRAIGGVYYPRIVTSCLWL